MKNTKAICLLFCMIVQFFLYSETKFSVLKGTEGIKFRTEVVSSDPYLEEIVVFVSGEDNRELCRISGSVNSFYTDEKDLYPKKMILKITTFDPPSSLNAVQLWFFDGNKGCFEKIWSSTAIICGVNDDISVLCVEDLHLDTLTNRTPVIILYDVNNMKEIKRFVYDKYRGTSVCTEKIVYKRGVFYFTLSDDGAHWSKESISVK